jgi:hypothetical protein
MIYDDQTSGEQFFRFNYHFMRITMYQTMPFEWQVRQIHLKVIEYLKDSVIYDYTTKWSFENENKQMLKHFMSAE